MRRLHADLIWCYKIIFRLADFDINDFLFSAIFLLLEDISINYTRNTVQVSVRCSFVSVL